GPAGCWSVRADPVGRLAAPRRRAGPDQRRAEGAGRGQRGAGVAQDWCGSRPCSRADRPGRREARPPGADGDGAGGGRRDPHVRRAAKAARRSSTTAGKGAPYPFDGHERGFRSCSERGEHDVAPRPGPVRSKAVIAFVANLLEIVLYAVIILILVRVVFS